MTSDDRPKEYSLTEGMIQKAIELDKSAYDMSEQLEELLRSCPRPSPSRSITPDCFQNERAKGNDTDPRICKSCLPDAYMRDGCWCYQMHDSRIREDILDLMSNYLAEHIYTCRGISAVDSIKMAKYIGSLRSSPKHEEQEQI